VILGYLQEMTNISRKHQRRIRTALGVPLMALLIASAMNPAASASNTRKHSLYSSRELWATIDVCNPADQPNVIGIRGSMPGDGHPGDHMYMSFRLQYMNTSTKTWGNVTSGVTPAFVPVGSGASARQGGSSFTLVPVAGKPPVTLRGLVEFQWRRGKQIVYRNARETATGHKSLAGADPPNYSQATCTIG
jgi:hypothetical protein